MQVDTRYIPIAPEQARPLRLAAEAPDARFHRMDDPAATLRFKLPQAAGFMSLAGPAPLQKPGEKDPARQAAEDLVALSLIKPLLREARNNPFKTQLFHGGQGEEIFGEQLDGVLADRIAAGGSLPVVEAVYRRFKAQPGQGVDRHG